jgi:hypothetical protein
MNKILDNEAFPVEERLEMAKVLLEMKDKEIQQLKAVIDNAKSDRDWIENPDRMGGQFTDEEIRRSGEWR